MPIYLLLAPLSLLYFCAITIRPKKKPIKTKAIVIVVGNISVGGNGKTPVVQSIAKQLLNAGFRVGIVARGYQSSHQAITLVTPTSNPYEVGDEPLLHAQQLQIPVVIGADRSQCVKKLVEQHQAQVVISDDGLQHQQMHRDFEIVLVDGLRQFGNRLLLPAGPLREPLKRLTTVDAIVHKVATANKRNNVSEKTYFAAIKPTAIVSVFDPQQQSNINDWQGKQIVAICGIGNPQQFFALLESLGMVIVKRIALPNHFDYRTFDLSQMQYPVLTTAKDAVKMALLSPTSDAHYLAIEAEIPTQLLQEITTKCQTLLSQFRQG